MRISHLAPILALTLLAACTLPGSTGTSSSSSSEASSMEASSVLPTDSSSSVTAMGTSSVAVQPSSVAGTQPRMVAVAVSNFAFSPTVITAKKGEKVTLVITGDSGIHGFAVPGLGLNVRVEAGQIVSVDLPTGTVGSFEAFCSIPCGPGHKSMKATIVIQ